MESYPDYTSEAELRTVKVRLLGTGAAVPTKVYGQGLAVARSGVGVYTLTFTEGQGMYAGCTPGFDATTASGLAGFTVVCTATSATVITVSLFNSANAAADLAAAQWINLALDFKQTSA
jgi:hypothetical protein